MQTTSPWYPVIVGAVGAGGALVGAVIAFLGTWLNRKSERERDLRHLDHERTLHWSEKRLTLYLEIVDAVEKHAEYVRKITQAFEEGNQAGAIEGWGKMASSRDGFRLLRQRAQILASSPVRMAVDHYYAAAEGVAAKRTRFINGEKVQVHYSDEAIGKLISCRTNVEESIRTELGTDTAELATKPRKRKRYGFTFHARE
ncbi:hypothetical protein [Amycolatopsis sp. NPDC004625]|uniref:hypothetical protein n=1 Tax=Amycolatopsis sp. NPDC004625 TaxID=3154670 RepID=UPI0033AE3E56